MTTTTTDPETAPATTNLDPSPPGRARRLLAGIRPWLFLAGVAVIVGLAGLPGYQASNPAMEYAVRATVVATVAAATAAWWWSVHRGRRWGFDLVPALLGGIAGLALVTALKGTPYAPGGISADQSFRTAAVTRFADSWQNADFTFQGLPSFYAPAYFWVLGRFADLTGTEPWRVLKLGTILTALLLPLLTYLLWRRLLPAHLAAPLAAVPLAVENYYEPYAWLVLFAIVPWWLAAVHGLHRPGRRPGHPVPLGILGGLLFMTYYYFFFIAAIAFVLYLLAERFVGRDAEGRRPRRRLARPAATLGIAAAVSAGYWLPLAISMLRAEHPQSLANRWFSGSHPDLPLPMLDVSVTGVVALLGLVWLLWTVRRDPLARGLLVFLAAAYGWYLLGAAAAVADSPLLSFRGKPLVPMILLIAGVLALARAATWAAGRLPAASAADLRRVGTVLAALLLILVGQQFVTTVRDSSLTEAAHTTALPQAAPPDPPPAALQQAIQQRYPGDDPPVLLSDRVDILTLYPNYGFLQWNAHYAHPAAEFDERVRYLTELSTVTDPAEFASRSAENRFDRIDGFILAVEGDELVYHYSADAFPGGLAAGEVRFRRTAFSPRFFQLLEVGEHLLAVRRA